MRAATSLGALVASSLVVQTAAQAADYGPPGGGSDAQPYGEADNNPQGDGAVTGQALPNGSPDGPACVMQGTKTVFITVYPTSPVSAAGGSLPEDSGPGKTVQHTLHPTRTIHVSPIGSPEGTQPSVSPYTTITVDIWGTGPGAEASLDAGADSPSISAANAPPPQGSPASLPAAYGDDRGSVTATADSNGPGGAADGTVVIAGSPAGPGTAVGPLASPYGPVNAASATADVGAQGPGGLSTWHTVVTDTDVHWVTGTAGPSPVTVLSEHTMVGTGPSPSNGNSVTCVTTTGPDGRPTILEWPVGDSQGNGGPPVSTPAGIPNGGAAATPQAVSIAVNPSAPQITSSSVSGAPASGKTVVLTTTASFIALGFNGDSRMIFSTYVITTVVPITAAPAPLPTDVPGPAQTQDIPNGAGITTCTSYTVLGADGKPTLVESTLVLPGPASTQAGALLPSPVQSGVSGPQGGVLASTTLTLLGANGFPTVVVPPFVLPGPVISPFPSDIPVVAITGTPYQPGNIGHDGITTCVTYTTVGPDGRPTIVESTVVMPASQALPTASNLGFPSTAAAQQTGLLQGFEPFGPAGGVVTSVVTTCITIDVLGPNGVATPVVETIVLTPAAPVVTTLGYPSVAPQRPQTDLPQGGPPFEQAGNAVTTCITVDVLGLDGVATPVVQTIVLPPSATVIGFPNASPVVNTVGLPGPVVQGGPLDTLGSGTPTLGAYGAGVPDLHTGLSGSIPVTAVPVFPLNPLAAGGSSDASAVLGSGSGVLSAKAYGWGSNDAQVYGSLSSLLVPQALGAATTLQTTTWTNVIPEQTTTYSIKFPFTTLATMASPTPLSPGKRAIRRQESSLTTPSWSNSTVSTLFPPPSSTPSTGDTGSTSAVCSSGGQVGNTTINFDNVKPGPLFNPSGDLWFSEGFLVAPPSSSQQSQSYVPSSGGQLVEFVPPSLSVQGTGDTAEIGVGPNSANPCFRFDFFGAQLGCAAQGSEKWCEFEVSAYTYNEGLSKEQSIAWSETKRVPACPSFPFGSCSLTPVEFEGYSNITSVLITLHVGLELRAWWGDDFRFGWSDNSCDAASCRARATPHRVKRETVESALRRGVWHWTPAGLHRLDDEYIWESVS